MDVILVYENSRNHDPTYVAELYEVRGEQKRFINDAKSSSMHDLALAIDRMETWYDKQCEVTTIQRTSFEDKKLKNPLPPQLLEELIEERARIKQEKGRHSLRTTLGASRQDPPSP